MRVMLSVICDLSPGKRLPAGGGAGGGKTVEKMIADDSLTLQDAF